MVWVIGRTRVPLPAARIIAFIGVDFFRLVASAYGTLSGCPCFQSRPPIWPLAIENRERCCWFELAEAPQPQAAE